MGGGVWLDEEVLSLFHFHEVPPLSDEEQLELVGVGGQGQLASALRGLVLYATRLRAAAAAEPVLEPLQLSTRLLLRIVGHLRLRPEDVDGALDRAFSAYARFLPMEAREKVNRIRIEAMRRVGLTTRGFGRTGGATLPVAPRVEDMVLTIGDARCAVSEPARPELVPSVTFVDIPNHVIALRDLLFDWSLGHHLLLVGNQGVGKNKLADRLLSLLRIEREYVQLHRDTTVQGLTLAPSLEAGVVVWRDSPLVRAARNGRCLVVDEADKAPLEVVCVLKALAEDGELSLLDGRTLLRAEDPRWQAAARWGSADGDLVRIDPSFRMIVLANRPGLPFLGNDFYRVCGDVFSCHAIDNPDVGSETALLQSVGPDVPLATIGKLTALFGELRKQVDSGKLSYPYSTRELVKLVTHLQRFPTDSLERATHDVFSFDVADPSRRDALLEILKLHGLAATAALEDELLGRNRGTRAYKVEKAS